jgi:hypothetical protein
MYKKYTSTNTHTHTHTHTHFMYLESAHEEFFKYINLQK